jgi:hypothetical protein
MMVCALILTVAPAYAGRLELPAGTSLQLKVGSGTKITSDKFKPGDNVPVVLAEPLMVGNIVVIEEGAFGKAEVMLSEPASKPGKPGQIQLKFTGLSPKGDFSLLDGQEIPLSGETEAFKGGGKKLLSYLLIFGLFIKGGQGQVPTDTTFTAQIAQSVWLESED